ncbi:MtaA/CmuA family methyltransferase [Candidatus Formimonas warabiya]|uniref:Methyltransferase n=1 Tax=Formimonas warabiya TaxID=1761012 RepID=A0A3G1KSP0_FORW1|nr:MtaA/CmuA family methyltransferase [Candidatus Formimonas warabiya]ATW25478.1 methyltransferase [Candidatus Formimonas warabiya]
MAMRKRERFLQALASQPVDRPAVFSACQHATYEQMEKLGVYWPEAHRNGKAMATLAEGGHTILGLDAVRVPYCQTFEVEALGGTIKDAGREGIPSVATHPYQLGEEPVFPEDFLSQGRIPQLLEAVRILKETVGEEVAVIGGIVGPYTVAVNLVGVPEMMKASFKRPDTVVPFLDLAEKAGTTLAKALIDAGADVICVEDMMASIDMLPPKIYRELAAPYEKKQFSQISVPTIIHICGRLDKVIADLAQTGCTAISVETSVNIAEAREKIAQAGLQVPLIGGVDPVRHLWNGTPVTVHEAVGKAVSDGISLISPGCAVAPSTPTENLSAMVQAAERSI